MFKYILYNLLIYIETNSKFCFFYFFFLKFITAIKILLIRAFGISKNNQSLDIIITVAKKDFNKVEKCIKSLKRHVQDNISEIFLIGPGGKSIFEIAKKNKCIFVDEKILIDKSKLGIKYKYKNVDRSNWLYQQLLNYKGVLVLGKENFKLAFNSDTQLFVNENFLRKKKILFNITNDYHKPYFDVAKILLNINRVTHFSFTAHYTVYDRTILSIMLKKIENFYKLDWHKVIIKKCNFKELSCHSEFETYGQFFHYYYRDNMILEYWFNRTNFSKNKFIQLFQNFFCKSISNHSWNSKN
jgi:hypothetical protein